MTVKCQRHTAIRAMARFTAIAAEERGRESAAVQKQNSLLAFFEAVRDRLRQFFGKNWRDLFLSSLSPKIDNPDQRHPLVVYALSQGEQFVLAGGSVVITLQGRRRAAEHDRTFLDLCPDHGDVARVI